MVHTEAYKLPGAVCWSSVVTRPNRSEDSGCCSLVVGGEVVQLHQEPKSFSSILSSTCPIVESD